MEPTDFRRQIDERTREAFDNISRGLLVLYEETGRTAKEVEEIQNELISGELDEKTRQRKTCRLFRELMPGDRRNRKTVSAFSLALVELLRVFSYNIPQDVLDALKRRVNIDSLLSFGSSIVLDKYLDTPKK